MLESKYQKYFIDRVRREFPGCIILKNDPNYLQGFCDWTILFGPYWAVVEIKTSENAPRQPNQDYYVDVANNMSYGSFVYPENEEIVLHELHKAFRSKRSARFPKR